MTVDTLPSRSCVRVPTALWRLPDFTSLPVRSRMAFLVLVTAPELEMLGLIYYHPSLVAERAGITLSAARSAVVDWVNAGLVEHDADSGLLWIVGHLERQLGAMPGTNLTKWVPMTCARLDRLPETPLVSRFRNHYGLPPRGQNATKPKRPKAPAKTETADRVCDREDRVSDAVPDTPLLILMPIRKREGDSAASSVTDAGDSDA